MPMRKDASFASTWSRKNFTMAHGFEFKGVLEGLAEERIFGESCEVIFESCEHTAIWEMQLRFVIFLVRFAVVKLDGTMGKWLLAREVNNDEAGPCVDRRVRETMDRQLKGEWSTAACRDHYPME